LGRRSPRRGNPCPKLLGTQVSSLLVKVCTCRATPAFIVAESRIEELKQLASNHFDFRKLVRLCDELNIASREDCHFANGNGVVKDVNC
jgi:hypothetical protein